MYIIYKRSSVKYLIYLTVLSGVLVLFYYLNYTIQKSHKRRLWRPLKMYIPQEALNSSELNVMCPVLSQPVPDMETISIFPNLDFNPSWLASGDFWNNWFDSRLQDLNRNSKKLPLKVILVPHSHNDPGWLETFQYYLQFKSIRILNNLVDTLQVNDTFKFVWAEVAFLEGWWTSATHERRMALRRLVRNGQIEIVTGGWVMPDEAVTSLYGLIDQYVEGHQWLKRYLDVHPKYGWSIDAFGHSSTVAHLLSLSGINATVIQRIHYAWKYWLAYQRAGDFYWIPNYASDNFMLTHNQPYHLYDTKSSCSPSSTACNAFVYKSHSYERDFEKIVDNVDDLINEYIKSGSFYKHNVILVPIGGDFSYVQVDELWGNYAIYSILIEETRKKYPLVDISFGTVKDYFHEVFKRQVSFPTLKGDFFVYSDPFVAEPSYWSGFYTSRPFLKILGRILEAQLRTCEILYTLTLNFANNHLNSNWDFARIVDARRVLDLFQHHDTITGTSKSFVVKDYITRLTNAIVEMLGVQRNAIDVLYGNNTSMYIVSEDNVNVYEDTSENQVYTVRRGERSHVVLFNSLLQPQSEFVKLVVNNFNSKVKNDDNVDIPIQISPVWKYCPILDKICAVSDKYEISFIATIPALTVVVYQLYHRYDGAAGLARIFSNSFHQNNQSEVEFTLRNISINNYIKFDNSELSVVFSGQNGFLRKIHKKSTKSDIYILQEYIGYNSYQFRSGAYLFQPDPYQPYDEDLFKNKDAKVMVILGNVYSEMVVVYKDFIVQKVRIYHTDTYLSKTVVLESTVNLELDVELAMRFTTNINNENVFYTDSNGFQIQKRITVPKIGVQGNYYPITSMIYIEDDKQRLTLLTGHALGGTSYSSGQLEVMLDRRMLMDDGRGLYEGISDNRKCTHKFIILTEVLRNPSKDEVATSSYLANHLSNSLNYPVNVYVNIKSYTFPSSYAFKLIGPMSTCNVHLVNLRTQPHYNVEHQPSQNALLVLHEQVFGCISLTNFTCLNWNHSKFVRFNRQVDFFKRTSLTGIENEESKPLRNIDEMFLGVKGLRTYNVTFGL